MQVEIETWCSKKRRVELIILECREEDARGELVKGKPVECGDQATCSGVRSDPRCLLNCVSMETRRKK